MDRTDLISWCLALPLLAFGCSGSDASSLVIANEQGDGDRLDITNVLIQDCITRYWDPTAIQFDNLRPMKDQGATTIAHGDSHTFDLAPGCHDVLVARDNGSGDESVRFSAARVLLDPGQTVTWIPFQVNDNDSWWCEEDCDEKK